MPHKSVDKASTNEEKAEILFQETRELIRDIAACKFILNRWEEEDNETFPIVEEHLEVAKEKLWNLYYYYNEEKDEWVERDPLT